MLRVQAEAGEERAAPSATSTQRSWGAPTTPPPSHGAVASVRPAAVRVPVMPPAPPHWIGQHGRTAESTAY